MCATGAKPALSPTCTGLAPVVYAYVYVYNSYTHTYPFCIREVEIFITCKINVKLCDFSFALYINYIKKMF